jgi:serine/threonine protein kinase
MSSQSGLLRCGAEQIRTMIGSRLAHYEITARLGSGGMGDVYQAADLKLGRSVAIKFLPETFAHDGERVARFQREARVLAALNHPNIATIHGFEESEGQTTRLAWAGDSRHHDIKEYNIVLNWLSELLQRMTQGTRR